MVPRMSASQNPPPARRVPNRPALLVCLLLLASASQLACAHRTIQNNFVEKRGITVSFRSYRSGFFAEVERKFAHPASISPERSSYRKYWDGDGAELLAVLESHLKEGVVRGIGEINVTHFAGRGFPEAD